MINLLFNWWLSYQFRTALKRGDRRNAKRILEEIEKSGAKLSWAEQLFKKQSFYQRELASLSRRLQTASSTKEIIKPDAQFIDFIYRSFNFIQHDQYKWQCTGIVRPIFDRIEAILFNFIATEL